MPNSSPKREIGCHCTFTKDCICCNGAKCAPTFRGVDSWEEEFDRTHKANRISDYTATWVKSFIRRTHISLIETACGELEKMKSYYTDPGVENYIEGLSAAITKLRGLIEERK